MGLYRRGRIYWFRKTIDGKRIQFSLKTGNKKTAEKLYAKSLSEIIEGRFFESIKARKITFKVMVDKFIKKYGTSRHETSLTHVLPVFGTLVLADIKTEKISDYIDERLEHVKRATVYQEYALMRRLFNVARREWKWTKDNPAADLSFCVGTSNARTRWLTYEEEEQLLKNASPEWLSRVIKFALHTGMRRGEILDIKWSSVNFKRRLVTVERSKNRQKRSIPMNETLLNLLKKPRVVDITNRVFPYSVSALKDAFPRARDKAGIIDFKFHDLRHTFATRLVQNGVDLYKIKDLLGHKDLKMSMRYAHHCSESLRSCVEILDKFDNSVKIGKVEGEDGLKNDLIAFKFRHGSV
jgi:integrase